MVACQGLRQAWAIFFFLVSAVGDEEDSPPAPVAQSGKPSQSERGEDLGFLSTSPGDSMGDFRIGGDRIYSRQQRKKK
jgi:hypothetical protein